MAIFSFSVIDALSVLLFAFGSGLLAEGLSYLLLYRTQNYQLVMKLTREAKLEANQGLGEKVEETKSEKSQKRERRDKSKDVLKNAKQEVSKQQFKSTFAVSFVLISFFGVLSST